MILQRSTHQLKQRRQSMTAPWPQSQSQSSINSPLWGSEFSSSQPTLPPVHVRSFSDQPFVPLATGSALRDQPTWNRQMSMSRERVTHTSMDKIVEEEGGGVQTLDHRPPGVRGVSRRNSIQSQSSERSADGGGLGPSGGRFSLQYLNGGGAQRRHSNQSQTSQRSLLDGQDPLVGGVVHVRSRSQPASGGTEEEREEEGDDEGSGILSSRNMGSKHTSCSDSEPAIAPPTMRHGSLLSLSRQSPATKELPDSAYSSGTNNLNPRGASEISFASLPRTSEITFAPPTRSALKRKGSGGVMEMRDEPVAEWLVSHGGRVMHGELG